MRRVQCGIATLNWSVTDCDGFSLSFSFAAVLPFAAVTFFAVCRPEVDVPVHANWRAVD